VKHIVIISLTLIAAQPCNAGEPLTVRSWVTSLGKLDPAPPPRADQHITTVSTENNAPELCAETIKDNTGVFESVIAFDPNSSVLYPGSVVEANSLTSGLLTAVQISLAPGTLTATDISISKKSSSISLEHPSLATIKDATDKLLRRVGDVNLPAKISFYKSSSSDINNSLASVGLSASWLGGGLTAALKAQSANTRSTTVIRYNQDYYSLAWTYRGLPISKTVSINDLRASNPSLIKKNPPVYIASVTYGRGFLIVASSSEEASTLEGAMSAAMGSGFVSGKAQLDASQLKVIQNAQVRLIAFGGNANDVVNLIDSTDKPNELRNYLKNGANWSFKKSPGVPISYRANYFDGSPAKLAFATTYKTRPQCRAELVTALRVHFYTGENHREPDMNIGVQIK
jgi:hypothetical protein